MTTRVTPTISGMRLLVKDIPQGRAINEALQAKYSFDVPNETLSGTVTRELTMYDAVNEIFRAATKLAEPGV